MGLHVLNINMLLAVVNVQLEFSCVNSQVTKSHPKGDDDVKLSID